MGWGVSDQGLNSLTNFAVNLVVARTLGPGEFGIFTIGFLSYLVCLGVSRSLSTEPFLVRCSGRSMDALLRAKAKAALGAALALGVMCSLLLLAIALVTPPRFGLVFAALALSMPGLLLQDAWRFIFIGTERPVQAFANDLVWAAALTGALVVAPTPRTTATLMLIWGLSGTAAALVGIQQAGFIPKLTEGYDWIRMHRDLGMRFLGEFMALSGSHQIAMYGVGLVGGLTSLGVFRSAQLLFGPINVLLMGVHIVAIPEGVKALEDSGSALRRMAMNISLILAMLSIVWGIGVLLIPEQVGEFLLGPSWAPARQLALPMMVSFVAFGVSVGGGAGLRAMAAARASLRARLIIAPLTVLGAVLGSLLARAPGAAWGLSAARIGESFLWWRALLIESHHHDQFGPLPTQEPGNPGNYRSEL